MASQLPLIAVSRQEFEGSAYRLAELLEQRDVALADFAEARKSHKEHLGAIDREMSQCRATIRRAQYEAEEGLMESQVDALLNQEEERRQ